MCSTAFPPSQDNIPVVPHSAFKQPRAELGHSPPSSSCNRPLAPASLPKPVPFSVPVPLVPYAAYVPTEVLPRYVSALTHTYVGHVGGSAHYSRTDFYANKAAIYIPTLFQRFDDAAASSFVECIGSSEILSRRIHHPAKLRRLRSFGNIVLERVSESFSHRPILEALVNEDTEKEFFRLRGK